MLFSLGFAGFGARLWFARVAFGFAEALDEADWRAGEIPFLADLIFEEALVAEMERIFWLVKIRNVGGEVFACVEVVDLDRTRFRRRAALQIDCLP